MPSSWEAFQRAFHEADEDVFDIFAELCQQALADADSTLSFLNQVNVEFRKSEHQAFIVSHGWDFVEPVMSFLEADNVPVSAQAGLALRHLCSTCSAREVVLTITGRLRDVMDDAEGTSIALQLELVALSSILLERIAPAKRGVFLEETAHVLAQLLDRQAELRGCYRPAMAIASAEGPAVPKGSKSGCDALDSLVNAVVEGMSKFVSSESDTLTTTPTAPGAMFTVLMTCVKHRLFLHVERLSDSGSVSGGSESSGGPPAVSMVAEQSQLLASALSVGVPLSRLLRYPRERLNHEQLKNQASFDDWDDDDTKEEHAESDEEAGDSESEDGATVPQLPHWGLDDVGVCFLYLIHDFSTTTAAPPSLRSHYAELGSVSPADLLLAVLPCVSTLLGGVSLPSRVIGLHLLHHLCQRLPAGSITKTQLEDRSTGLWEVSQLLCTVLVQCPVAQHRNFALQAFDGFVSIFDAQGQFHLFSSALATCPYPSVSAFLLCNLKQRVLAAWPGATVPSSNAIGPETSSSVASRAFVTAELLVVLAELIDRCATNPSQHLDELMPALNFYRLLLIKDTKTDFTQVVASKQAFRARHLAPLERAVDSTLTDLEQDIKRISLAAPSSASAVPSNATVPQFQLVTDLQQPNQTAQSLELARSQLQLLRDLLVRLVELIDGPAVSS